MRHWNFVARQKSGIAMALCASIRQVLAKDGRVRLAGGLYGVDGAVAGFAFGSVGVTVFRGLPMDTGFELLHLLRMTVYALSRTQIFRGSKLVHVAVTRSARGFAKYGVDAGGGGLGFVRVAGGALHFRNLEGCGNSLMSVWQSLQPRTPWALAECLAGSIEMLFPASDFIPASPWHARHSWSAAGEAEARVRDNASETKTARVTNNFNTLLPNSTANRPYRYANNMA